MMLFNSISYLGESRGRRGYIGGPKVACWDSHPDLSRRHVVGDYGSHPDEYEAPILRFSPIMTPAPR